MSYISDLQKVRANSLARVAGVFLLAGFLTTPIALADNAWSGDSTVPPPSDPVPTWEDPQQSDGSGGNYGSSDSFTGYESYTDADGNIDVTADAPPTATDYYRNLVTAAERDNGLDSLHSGRGYLHMIEQRETERLEGLAAARGLASSIWEDGLGPTVSEALAGEHDLAGAAKFVTTTVLEEVLPDQTAGELADTIYGDDTKDTSEVAPIVKAVSDASATASALGARYLGEAERELERSGVEGHVYDSEGRPTYSLDQRVGKAIEIAQEDVILNYLAHHTLVPDPDETVEDRRESAQIVLGAIEEAGAADALQGAAAGVGLSVLDAAALLNGALKNQAEAAGTDPELYDAAQQRIVDLEGNGRALEAVTKETCQPCSDLFRYVVDPVTLAGMVGKGPKVVTGVAGLVDDAADAARGARGVKELADAVPERWVVYEGEDVVPTVKAAADDAPTKPTPVTVVDDELDDAVHRGDASVDPADDVVLLDEDIDPGVELLIDELGDQHYGDDVVIELAPLDELRPDQLDQLIDNTHPDSTLRLQATAERARRQDFEQQTGQPYYDTREPYGRRIRPGARNWTEQNATRYDPETGEGGAVLDAKRQELGENEATDPDVTFYLPGTDDGHVPPEPAVQQPVTPSGRALPPQNIDLSDPVRVMSRRC